TGRAIRRYEVDPSSAGAVKASPVLAAARATAGSTTGAALGPRPGAMRASTVPSGYTAPTHSVDSAPESLPAPPAPAVLDDDDDDVGGGAGGRLWLPGGGRRPTGPAAASSWSSTCSTRKWRWLATTSTPVA